MTDELEPCVVANTKRMYRRYLEVAGCGTARIINFKTYLNNVHLKGLLIEHQELTYLEKELNITESEGAK